MQFFFSCHKTISLLAIALLFSINVCSQVETPVSATTEQQVENITAANNDTETEDDSYLQEMEDFIKNPINLNYATETELQELMILTPLQIQNLISYRTLLGKLSNIYELQAVPTWDVVTIKKLQPYIIVSIAVNTFQSVTKRLHGGERALLIRGSQVIEKAKGYTLDPGSTTNYYPGSPQKILLRYTYHFKGLLQYGILAEKDAGEQFFKGRQKQGFDFYSAHFFARDLGFIKALAFGDFTVNLGQGLISWQSLAFKKGGDVLNIKRQSAILRPYNSSGEINFHRGIGITIGKRKWTATLFGSYKKIDANLVADTLSNNEDFVSSFQSSGYHRTNSERDDKSVQQQLVIGGNFSYKINNLHIGVNAIKYHFKLPLIKGDEPYNKYALSGTSFGNYSIDYSYTYRNIHFFGEAATTANFNTALVNGMLISVANSVDVSLLYRNIKKEYQSLYSNAFTEATYPSNEKGLYAGISIRPSIAWRIDAYADFYKFPWLRYRVDMPSTGAEFLFQIDFKPTKQFEAYTRYKFESKAINVNPDDITLPPIPLQPRQNWRTNFSYKISDAINLRSRIEMCWFDKKGTAAENGFLTYLDLEYQPPLKAYSGSMRFQYFETDGYASRLYAFENDVLYSYSVPVVYGKGYRYYLNLHYNLNKKTSIWVRGAQTRYIGKSLIGSGLDEIKGEHRTEFKIQLVNKF